ncbi:serine hydrolase domain-containing protein [Melissococcus plutonius]|uniref:Beta-lactamase class C and other penicillin binding proteins n=1 Tax=Melissococcus plutonius TaxID=33970 RepID=A0A2Z5Y1F9_9ENTE|nr:serine hydrolase domain-containing protein [Melissococcus plutonius]BAL61765.1 beta-lactamase class C-like protein [Melissococcus plutonius DAT561]MCV2498288.1 beta-lactamase family protein [Melissococcus plutonius]MCV2500847.1 beta-lactamase family protein [Melissococcus plutonius]MCV2504601.1 beta-lactamase family protein [Melissococcus plutonius]MCV2506903.1 beta-lactamase family protein [Melissococcus plutonius]
MYKQTQAMIQELLKKKIFPGVAFTFIRNNNQESYCFGDAQLLPTRQPLTPNLLFDVASLTKVICTTTVILKLWQEGIIALEDPIKKYYPDFNDEKITIHHLMTHTSDITGYISNRDQLNKEELRKAYNQLQSGKYLGKRVMYTDTGTILLGFMLESIFNEDVVTIFTKNVLQPLQMSMSTFLPDDYKICIPTENHKERGIIQGQTHDPKAFILKEHAGNAGLFTNNKDLVNFVSMYLNEGSYEGKCILTPETIQALLINQTPFDENSWSLGWKLKNDLSDNHPLLFHTGYTGTFLLIDVQQKEAFIFLSNRIHPVDHKEIYIKCRDELVQQYLEEKAAMTHKSLD